MTEPRDRVESCQPRQTALATFPDGRCFEAPIGTTVEAYMEAAFPDPEVPYIAALVDYTLRELSYGVKRDVEIDPIFLSDSDGFRIYRRTLSFVMVTAISELFPETHVIVDHSIPDGGYFCRVLDREPFSAEELDRIEEHMRAIVEEDAPVIKEKVPIED
ncbi:MAG: nucleoside kinase, partial [Anaerolineae bacterium]